MEQKLEISTSLSLELKLTPALIQSIQLLQLPLQKLEDFLKDEIEDNPLIELEDDTESIWDQVDIPVVKENEFDILSLQPSQPTSREILLQQARLEFEGERLKVAEVIINSLNTSGFLEVDEETISAETLTSLETVREVREAIKRFEPVGCACYSLKESFKVQMEEIKAPRRFVELINDIDLLKKGKQKFLRETKISEEDFSEFLRLLKLLNPEPGNLENKAIKIVPDLNVYLENKKVKVEVAETAPFKFKINSSYLKHASTRELKQFLAAKYQRAMNLKRAIEQRNKTLKEIAQFVFLHQIKFLENGKDIKPLLYKDISQSLSIHESTISRAVKDKFVQTPFGVYPFKAFFRRSISGTSVEEVKEEIRKIINSEDKKKPFGDNKIAEILLNKGIKIARRTVAKYREEMGIPNAFNRREL